MYGINSKGETFSIKMEEMMKQALSSEDFDVDDNMNVEEKMAQVVKKEPNEKPLLVEDFKTFDPATSNKDCFHPYNLQASNEQLTEENSVQQALPEGNSVQQTLPEGNSAQQTLLEGNSLQQTLPEGYSLQQTLPKEKSLRQILPKENSPEQTLPEAAVSVSILSEESALETTTPEEHNQSDSVLPEEQTPSEHGQVDIDLIQNDKESIIDRKPIITIDYTSIHCKSCGISFNDNFGFRRHLFHVVHRNQDSVEDFQDVSSLSERTDSGIASISSSSPPLSPSTSTLKKQNSNVNFKRQYRANLKPRHLKSLTLPKSHPRSPIHIQCRFCKKEGWTESGYRHHLLDSHFVELNPLTKQITDSNIERIKDTSTLSIIPSDTNTFNACPPPSMNRSPVADQDITILDIPYDPITDISENQRRTYRFFQTYMLDIN